METYTDISFADGTSIRVLHEATLGDLIVGTLLALLLAFLVFSWISDKIWGRR